MSEPLRVRGDVSREERRRLAPVTWTEAGARYYVANDDDGTAYVDQRTGPADRRGPVSARHAALEAEVLRLRGFQAALEENARLHKLLDDANALLAVAKPDQEAMARTNYAVELTEEAFALLAAGVAAGALDAEEVQ